MKEQIKTPEKELNNRVQSTIYKDAQGTQRQKEKRKSKKLKTYLKKIMENFPYLGKEIDFQEVQEAQRVPEK